MKPRHAPAMEFDIDPAAPVYVIGVVSQLVRLPVWTLRVLDREGLVRPKRRVGRARLYSLDDVRRLLRIRQLYQERRVNAEGVRIILQLEAR
jgi:DNA-binding transcriptional MerR regulator